MKEGALCMQYLIVAYDICQGNGSKFSKHSQIIIIIIIIIIIMIIKVNYGV